jgi:hypothetical protein
LDNNEETSFRNLALSNCSIHDSAVLELNVKLTCENIHSHTCKFFKWIEMKMKMEKSFRIGIQDNQNNVLLKWKEYTFQTYFTADIFITSDEGSRASTEVLKRNLVLFSYNTYKTIIIFQKLLLYISIAGERIAIYL